MAQVVITIPDAQVTRVNDAFAAVYGYQATLPNGDPNPQTKAQFAKARTIDYIKDVVKSYEAQRDAEVARQAAIDSVDAGVTPT
jgi:hypothetical protein